MTLRAALLLGALLATPAGAQDPPPEAVSSAPKTTASSFALSSDSIRHIVKATAAAQSVPVRMEKETPTAPPAERMVVFAPPERIEKPAPMRSARSTASDDDNFVSAMVGTLFDVGVDDLLDNPQHTIACQSRPDLGTTTERCPACKVVLVCDDQGYR